MVIKFFIDFQKFLKWKGLSNYPIIGETKGSLFDLDVGMYKPYWNASFHMLIHYRKAPCWLEVTSWADSPSLQEGLA